MQQEINNAVCRVAATLVNDCPSEQNEALNTDAQRAADSREATLPSTCVNAALHILSADYQATCYNSVITLNIAFNKDGHGTHTCESSTQPLRIPCENRDTEHKNREFIHSLEWMKI